MRTTLCRLSLFVLAVAGLATFDAAPAVAEPEDPGTITEAADPVPGQYIVTLQPEKAVRATSAALAEEYDGEVLDLYRHSLRGFSVEMDRADALALSGDPAVLAVEEDGVVQALGTQANPPWGLDRIDQRDRPLNQSYTYGTTGDGVTAYIIDTGIRIGHVDFGGRASIGTDTVGDGQNGNDCNGHGTHVAGTVGGSTYGVAKDVDLVAVRVLNCQGSGATSGVIAGVDWVTANHSGPSLANMSLGGGASSALDTAVRNSIAAGVTYALAAGNDNANACNGSPARTLEALTVGATGATDARASFSNFGSCVDLFAPGEGILSAWSTSNTATNTISGTSMASPHVAGVAATYLEEHPGAAPAAVNAAIVGSASQNQVSNPGTGSPNLLLYGDYDDQLPPPPPPTPPANDAFAQAQALAGDSGSVPGTTINATREAGEPAHAAGNTGNGSVWYRWTAPAPGTLVVNTAGSNFDTLLAAYTGSAVNALTSRASNDDSNGTLQSRISFTVTASTSYSLAVDGYGSAEGSVILGWAFTPSGPPPDTTDPTVTITSPADGSSFTRGAVVAADYGCADTGGSGLATCVGDVADGSSIDTSTLGPHTFTVTATDGAGNDTSVTHDYTVVAPTCFGLPVTVMLALGDTPTDGDDVILGTPGADTVNGGIGTDLVCALGGVDRITGGAGGDLLFGGVGADVLHGGAGPDILVGGDGNDSLNAGPQHDTCYGQAGTDQQTDCEVLDGIP